MKFTMKTLLIIAIALISSTLSASILKSLDNHNTNAYSTPAEAFAAAPTIDKISFAAYKTPTYVERIEDVRGNNYSDKNKEVTAEAEAGSPNSGLPKNITPGLLPRSK